MLITVYARRERTLHPDCLCLERVRPGSTKRLTDIAVYRDAACTQLFARFGPHISGRPRVNTKVVTLNCWRWALKWVPTAH